MQYSWDAITSRSTVKMEVSTTGIRLPWPSPPYLRKEQRSWRRAFSGRPDTRRSPDLAACGDRYRTRRHQNQIRDAKLSWRLRERFRRRVCSPAKNTSGRHTVSGRGPYQSAPGGTFLDSRRHTRTSSVFAKLRVSSGPMNASVGPPRRTRI